MSKLIAETFDIYYTTTIYVTMALLCSIAINYNVGTFKEEVDSSKNLTRVFFELITFLWMFYTLTHIARFIMGFIPSPFDGIGRYNHNQLPEYLTAGVFTAFMILTVNYREKLIFFMKRIMKRLT